MYTEGFRLTPSELPRLWAHWLMPTRPCRIHYAGCDRCKSLDKATRKQRQIEHAAHACPAAKLVKLADKICNLRDIANCPPADWSLERKQAYFDWAKAVVDWIRGAHPGLERLFDEAYARLPAP